MALRYWVTGGTGNYNSTTNWSASSGGASGASIPTTADDAIWDVNSGSGNAIINVSSVAKSVDFTNFTGTVDFQNTLAVAGNMTLGTGMSFANTTGTATLRVTAAATLTSNGVAFPYNFSVLTGVVTITLAGDWECQNFIHDVSTGNATLNGNNFFINGNLSNLNTVRFIQGTTVFVMQGTGSISSLYTTSNQYFIVNNLTINTSGTITFATDLGPLTSGVWTYTAGTVITTGMILRLRGVFDLDGVVFENIDMPVAATITFLSDLVYTNSFTTLATSSSALSNGASIRHIGSTGGFINLIGSPGGSSRFGGTTVLSLEGSGTFNTGGASGTIGFPVVVNTSGTYTANPITALNGTTFTYTAGTIDFSGVDIRMQHNNQTTTFNGVSPLSFGQLSVGNGSSEIYVVLNDVMNVDVIDIKGNGNTIYIPNRISGTAPFICNTLIFGARAQSFELQSGLTYIVNSSMKSSTSGITYTNINISRVKSTVNASKVNITLSPGATQEISYCDFQDVDSSNGQTIWVFGSTTTITNCDNINSFTQPKSVGF
jgi:hypothetical protein